MQATSTQKGAFRLHRQVTYLPWGKHPGRVVVFCFVFFFPLFLHCKTTEAAPLWVGYICRDWGNYLKTESRDAIR